jgi:hypothetical protein
MDGTQRRVDGVRRERSELENHLIDEYSTGKTKQPPLKEVEPRHFMRCHISLEELRRHQLADRGAVAAAPGEGTS